jgi:hypothetical protein
MVTQNFEAQKAQELKRASLHYTYSLLSDAAAQ